MNNTTLNFSNRAGCVALGQSYPSLAILLYDTVGIFAELTIDANLKTAAVINDAENIGCDYEDGGKVLPDKKPSRKKRKLNSKVKVDEEAENKFMTQSVLGSIEDTSQRSMLGYEMTWETSPQEKNPALSEITAADCVFNALSQYSSTSSNDQWFCESASENGQTSQASLTSSSAMSPKALSSLRPPLLYCCIDSTFARRLHRATLQKALHLIGDQILRPNIFKKKFQLCLPYGDSEQIFNKINAPCDVTRASHWNGSIILLSTLEMLELITLNSEVRIILATTLFAFNRLERRHWRPS